MVEHEEEQDIPDIVVAEKAIDPSHGAENRKQYDAACPQESHKRNIRIVWKRFLCLF
ncbi:MAG: hypothetical protein ACRD8Z_05925 [Nitrososphaeraceae archaeon]